MNASLRLFDPRVAAWFGRRYGAPTEIQERAWPRIAAGEHVLASAPTGSGKTLAGFLWALDRLLTGTWEGGGLRVLYVSPLKALNADIERNLRAPLAGLRRELAAAGFEAPAVHVAVRSGDTPPAERARMLRRAPEILITTPESLNLLLLSARAPGLFAGLRTVILDEIHAVASSKRGTHLITAVERLVRHAGEFQRVAMSATVRPAGRVARFVGGWRPERAAGGATRFEPRPVAIVEAESEKRYELSVRFPFAPAGEAGGERDGDAFWRGLAEDLRARIAECRSTLVFTNSRRSAEKTTRFVNEAAGRELAWSHHGSLSRELRRAVEERLKEGSLPAIVATSSLELGIDVGALDRVLLLQAPRSLASAAQRVGRAGHGVGEVSRAIFYPTHARDFLDCAVAVRAVRAGEIEPVRPVRSPLDLLAQTVLACVARERWRLEDLYDFVRAADSFHDLARRQFDLVVEMLAGRYADARVEELRPRVTIDLVAGTIEGRPGLARLLARAGGTIPDRGYFQLRVEGSGAKLGELDEEFVWERSVGDGFVLGAQAWRVQSIGTNEVVVAPARGGALLAPFWRADARDRGAHFSERVADLLQTVDAGLDDPGVAADLAGFGLEPPAAAELVRLLREQRAVQGVSLPHRRHLVIEEVAGAGEQPERREVLVFTFWGGTVNRPLALALAALWQEREGTPLETLSDDDAVLLVLPPGADARELLTALEPGRCEELLRARLETTGFFGAHFRQNAQRALLLPRALPGRRMPLWVSRQNAKRLLEAVARHDDFPLVLETWRTCLADEFELDVLRERLQELADGRIRVSSVRTARPSPFAAGLVRARTNELMYEDDAPEARRASALRGDLLREIALQADGRPAIPAALVERFTAKAQRLLPGYAPRDAAELLEWVKERLIVPLDEWRALLDAIDRDRVAAAGEPAAAEMVAAIAPKLVRWRPSPATAAVSALETVLRLPAGTAMALAFATTARALEEGGELEADPAALAARAPAGPAGVPGLAAIVAQLLPFYGSLSSRFLEELTGASAAEMEAAVEQLLRGERAVAGELIEGAGEPRIAARTTFETLLRWKRAAARPELRPLPLEMLPVWVAGQQGLLERGSGPDDLRRALERLFGAALPAGLWEREALPARLEGYQPAWLDALLDDSELVWTGAGIERVAFVFRGDLDLLAPEGAPDAPADGDLDARERRVLDALRGAPRGLELADLAETTGVATGALAVALWSLAWRGRVACDSMRALRQGVLARFEPLEATGEVAARPSRRGSFRRWRASRPFPGRWLAAAPAGVARDPLAAEERSRERARLLVERWGVLFRELVAHEAAPFAWGRVARSLRALELAGEVVAGRYFEGVPGLQFATPSALERLRDGGADRALWWQNAADPSSLAGVDLPALRSALPRRLPTTQLVWRGARLAAVLRRSGRELELRVGADDPDLGALVEPLRVALARAFDPERGVEVESINGEPAATSPWRGALDAFAVTREGGGVLRARRRWT